MKLKKYATLMNYNLLSEYNVKGVVASFEKETVYRAYCSCGHTMKNQQKCTMCGNDEFVSAIKTNYGDQVVAKKELEIISSSFESEMFVNILKIRVIDDTIISFYEEAVKLGLVNIKKLKYQQGRTPAGTIQFKYLLDNSFKFGSEIEIKLKHVAEILRMIYPENDQNGDILNNYCGSMAEKIYGHIGIELSKIWKPEFFLENKGVMLSLIHSSIEDFSQADTLEDIINVLNIPQAFRTSIKLLENRDFMPTHKWSLETRNNWERLSDELKNTIISSIEHGTMSFPQISSISSYMVDKDEEMMSLFAKFNRRNSYKTSHTLDLFMNYQKTLEELKMPIESIINIKNVEVMKLSNLMKSRSFPEDRINGIFDIFSEDPMYALSLLGSKGKLKIHEKQKIYKEVTKK